MAQNNQLSINTYSIINTVAANGADLAVANNILTLAGKGFVDLTTLQNFPTGFTAPVAEVASIYTLTVAGTGTLVPSSLIVIDIEQVVGGSLIHQQISYSVPATGATQANTYAALNSLLAGAGAGQFDFTTSGAMPNVITTGAGNPLLTMTVTSGATNITSLTKTANTGIAAVGLGSNLIASGVPVANSSDYYASLTCDFIQNNGNGVGMAGQQTHQHTFYVDVNSGGATVTGSANYNLLASLVASALEGGTVVTQREAYVPSAGQTLTAAQLSLGYIDSSTATSGGASTITLPTATALATQLGATAGSEFTFIVDNSAGAGALTVVVGAGIVVPTTAITGGVSLAVSVAQAEGKFSIFFTSATAANIRRVW